MAGKLKTLYVILLTKTRTHTNKQKQQVYENSSRLLFSKLFSLVKRARTSGNRDKLQRGSFGLNIKGWLITQTLSRSNELLGKVL